MCKMTGQGKNGSTGMLSKPEELKGNEYNTSGREKNKFKKHFRSRIDQLSVDLIMQGSEKQKDGPKTIQIF